MPEPLTPEQKEDLQFWFYEKVFTDRWPIEKAIEAAAREIGAPSSEVEAYLALDGRLTKTPSGYELPEHSRDDADPKGVYLDLEWTVQLLKKAGKQGAALHQAVGIIFKITTAQAREEVEALPEVEEED